MHTIFTFKTEANKNKPICLRKYEQGTIRQHGFRASKSTFFFILHCFRINRLWKGKMRWKCKNNEFYLSIPGRNSNMGPFVWISSSNVTFFSSVLYGLNYFQISQTAQKCNLTHRSGHIPSYTLRTLPLFSEQDAVKLGNSYTLQKATHL